jgi:hypothetical protein
VTLIITDRKRAIALVNCPTGIVLQRSHRMRRIGADRISSAVGSRNEPGWVNNTPKQRAGDGEISTKKS